MNKILFSYIFLISLVAPAQSPSWQWAKMPAANNSGEGYAVCTGPEGDVYVTGRFTGTAVFGNSSLTCNGSTDIIVVRYSPGGSVVWAKNFGGSSYDVGVDIFADASGYIYVTGNFSSPTITFGNTTLMNAGGQDVFLIKCDANGNVIWAKGAGGDNLYENGSCVRADRFGNIYLSGSYGNNARFDSTVLSSNGKTDAFLAKYDMNGDLFWIKTIGNINMDHGGQVTVDDTGNVYNTGTVTAGWVTIGNATYYTMGGINIFLVKYDSNGNIIWAQVCTGGYNYASGLVIDKTGSLFMTGSYDQTMTIGYDTLSCTGWGFFLAKCDAGGHVNILEHAAGAGANFNYGMAEDANGCIYICGTSTSDSIPFDTIILRKPFNHPGWWLFLAKYNNNLKPLWAKTAKGDNSDFAWSVTTGIGYTVYLTGSVSGNASIFDNDTLTTPAPAKMFLAKLKSEDGTALAGLPKENNDDGFMVYPNPTTGKFSLRITEGVPAVTGPRIAAITIYNALGENVFSAKDLLSGTWIDLSDRAKGIYFVQIRSGKGSSTQKILIR